METFYLMIYNNYMVMPRVNTGGKPCVVAVIPFRNERKVSLVSEFYDTCETFRYPEIYALSRALRISTSTVENWKYKITFPRWDIAIDVIEWVRNGKPMVKMSPVELATPIM